MTPAAPRGIDLAADALTRHEAAALINLGLEGLNQPALLQRWQPAEVDALNEAVRKLARALGRNLGTPLERKVPR